MSRTVLIVDDRKVDNAILSSLSAEDYSVLHAQGDAESVSLLCDYSKRISAIILHIDTNGTDGLELLSKLREKLLYQAVPIIVTAESDAKGLQEKTLARGANGFITEPYSCTLLLRTIENAVKLCDNAAMSNVVWRDKLTGLLNRESFFIEAERHIKQHEAGYYVLSILDVENFKLINDQYGIEMGDEVLKHIADSLDKYPNSSSGITCRYMADKFAALFPAKLRSTFTVRENYRLATSPKCINRTIRIRVGRYVVNDLSLPVSSMFDRASLAEASVKGRYDIYLAEYTESMREVLLHEQQIVNDMEDALKNGEFEPWFQPQYNHATGAIIGSEALIRWRRDGRIVPPNDFIPIFERNGFIYKTDRYIWRQVCILLRRWIDEGKKPLPVSVNISRYDIFQADFLEVLGGLVKEYGLPVDLLRLEITESAFAESTNTIINVVNELIRRGFTVEIDDFGSGYSSLNTLKDVPASILKLDMKFFENTENRQRGGNIVESVVRMAKWLGMAVIAEGVEDKAQADYLKSIGCYYIQGYFYAKPMPTADYEKLLALPVKEPQLTRLQTLKNLDNSEFWNPESMETLIFNSYVGGACIFEFTNGKAELLRVNEQYYQELGIFASDKLQLHEMSAVEYLDEENAKLLFDNIYRAINTNKESACELTLCDSSVNPPHKEYIRSTVRLIAHAAERYLFYCVIVNLTEQRVAEQNEREAEKRRLESARQLEVIMSNVNGGVSAIQVFSDGSSHLIFSNERYYELFGYTRAQAIEQGIDVMKLIIPEDLPRVLSQIEKLKADGVPIIIDYRCTKRDGHIAYIRANSSLMYMDGHGDVITSVLTDITEKKSLEDQLQALVDNINGGVTVTLIKDGKQELLVVNNRFYEILGYNDRAQFELECADGYSSIHPDDRERVKTQFETSGCDQKQYAMEYRIIRRDGEVRYIRNNISVVSLFGIDGPVLLSVENDITELRLAQQNADEMAQRFKKVLNSVGNGITAFALRPDNLEMLFINDKYYELVGYTPKDYSETTKHDMLALIYHDDREYVFSSVTELNKHGGNKTLEFRVVRCDGKTIWMRSIISVTSLAGIDVPVQIAVFSDITEQHEERERLRVSEEFNKLALEQSGNIITRFDVETCTLTLPDSFNPIFVLEHVLKNMPEEQIDLGRVSPDTADEYRRLFYGIMRGNAAGRAVYKQNSSLGWRWLEAQFTTVFSSTGEPVSAVISFTDITEKLEKEVVYNKWKQSLKERPENSYALFRCNLSKGASFDSWEGKLLTVKFDDKADSFNDLTAQYVKQCLYKDDREKYMAFLNSNTMLAEYYRGHRSDFLEYREKGPGGIALWRRLTVDLVEYPNSNDIEAYLMYEDIDEQKKADLLTLERSETDPLTGILNRATFIEKMEEILQKSQPEDTHAMLMLDVDDFKHVNDSLGHGAGDKVLMTLTGKITSVLRKGDLIGRLGGDEFFVFLKDMPDKRAVAAKAKRICDMKIAVNVTDKIDGVAVTTTISMGIAMVPTDGSDFDTLYKKVDEALYRRKQLGKNGYLFVTEDE